MISWFRYGVVVALLAPIAVAVVGGTSAVEAKPDGSREKVRAVDIDTTVINNFHKEGATRDVVGKLKWRGGLVLSSPDKSFGGYSGLALDKDGRRFLAVSDAGTWLAGEIIYVNGRMAGIKGGRLGPLKALGNKVLRRRRDRDAEAVRLLSGNLVKGQALIAFEVNQRIGVFPIRNGQLRGPTRYLRPGRRLRRNKGIEAIALVGPRQGRQNLIAFAERSLDGNGHHRGWIWRRAKGKPRAIALTNVDGFDITDAVGLADGRLLVLERRFRWSEGVKMRLREIAAEKIRPGAVLSGRTLVRADLRYQIDNMEGMDVHVDKRGRSVVTMISDDNFNAFLQRTVLLQFELQR